MDYCCPSFESAIDRKEIESDDDEMTWNIAGCCGHCYVILGVRFCPFCGRNLQSFHPLSQNLTGDSI